MSEAFLPVAASIHPVERFAVEAMKRACCGCNNGHAVWREVYRGGNPDWSHGVETLESGVTIPPEPCDAAAIWETLYQWRSKERK